VYWNHAIGFLERRPDLFRNIEGFIHPAFLGAPSDARFKGAYLHITDSYYGYGTFAVSLPFFTTGQIIQGLTDYLRPLEFSGYDVNSDVDRGSMHPIMAAYASQVRKPGQL
jgi:hypothetical protein